MHKKYIYEIPNNGNHAANKALASIKPGSNILEIGCASGIQSRVLTEQMGCHVTGIEIDPISAEDARPFCSDLIIADIEKTNLSEQLKNKTFDYILFIDVIEHLLEATTVLKKVLPLLTPEGIIIASIPNITHAAICWEIAHGRFDYQDYGLLDNTHRRFFTKKSICKLFEDSGLEISSWDRTTKEIHETEFHVFPSSPFENDFLDWIFEINKEAKTYQFIIEARIQKNKTSTPTYHEIAEGDIIQKLINEVESLKIQNMKTNSQLTWLEDNRYHLLSKCAKKLKRKLGNYERK